MYWIFCAFSGILQGCLCMLIYMVLANSGYQLLFENHQNHNVIITGHATLMIVFMVIPVVMEGFGSWLVPIMIGSPYVALLRLYEIFSCLLSPPLC